MLMVIEGSWIGTFVCYEGLCQLKLLWNMLHHELCSMKGMNNSSAKIPHVTIDSDSDSDSEGFVEELTRVNFTSNGKAASGSLKTGGKTSSVSKDAGKGGNTYISGKGGKGSASTAVSAKSDAELKLELDVPPNSRILMNCEAAELLQEIHEHMAILSEDPKIKIPESFDKAFQYAKEGNHFSTAQSVKQVLDPLKKYGVSDGEMCLIANIGPETIEEVYALVPSLKATRSFNEVNLPWSYAGMLRIKQCGICDLCSLLMFWMLCQISCRASAAPASLPSRHSHRASAAPASLSSRPRRPRAASALRRRLPRRPRAASALRRPRRRLPHRRKSRTDTENLIVQQDEEKLHGQCHLLLQVISSWLLALGFVTWSLEFICIAVALKLAKNCTRMQIVSLNFA
ncbi:hypothetical protein GUJ93_ZPchr0002g25528 [Zizania palustris]|uniref:RNA polymerase Rpb4/RPC9 core domain-containing protein n=1 Tax=Zizania palustris TaxID=103762 RepID=A0A8J5V4V0_ZIZPA|nr:hypothetical protein GUJ93_ZPchr0002g25528 [Zizania palustris]